MADRPRAAAPTRKLGTPSRGVERVRWVGGAATAPGPPSGGGPAQAWWTCTCCRGCKGPQLARVLLGGGLRGIRGGG
eukprot:5493644-Pyramimonas_sp.AAC.1